LGDKFKLSAFHDEILGAGALPLDVLSKRIEEWVAGQKSNASPSTTTLDSRGSNSARAASHDR
jgi:hypothetical protein